MMLNLTMKQYFLGKPSVLLNRDPTVLYLKGHKFVEGKCLNESKFNSL